MGYAYVSYLFPSVFGAPSTLLFSTFIFNLVFIYYFMLFFYLKLIFYWIYWFIIIYDTIAAFLFPGDSGLFKLVIWLESTTFLFLSSCGRFTYIELLSIKFMGKSPFDYSFGILLLVGVRAKVPLILWAVVCIKLFIFEFDWDDPDFWWNCWLSLLSDLVRVL